MFLVYKKARENKIASYFLWFGYFYSMSTQNIDV
jgi:hypothetical protein